MEARDWQNESMLGWHTETPTPTTSTQPPPPKAVGSNKPDPTVSELGTVAGGTGLASRAGAFGDASKQIGGYAGDLGNVLGIYQGLQKGGVVGDVGAGVNAAALGSRLGVFGGASSDIMAVAGPLAAGLAVYNFAENWRSGATGADAASGAEAGAAIGSVIGPEGTLIGAVVGGVVGGVSSLFGPGRQDPENTGWDQYAQAYSQNGAAGVAGAKPSDNYQMLAGIFDSRGSQIPFYNQFGRMGEGAFTGAMTTQINQALKAGKISKTDTPQTIYSKVVQPWINSMSPGGWQNTNTVGGVPEKAAVANLLTSMIGQYQKGQQTGWTGIDGQAAPAVQPFGALGSSDPAAAKAIVARQMGPVHDAVTTMPGFGGSGSSTSAMLPLMLAMPALGAAMANPAANTGGQSPMMGAGGPGGDPTGGGDNTPATGTPAATPAPSTTDNSLLSDLGTGISSFLSGPLGTLAEFGTLGAIGLSQANSQKNTNDQLASGLATAGQPFTQAGQAELTQLQGGPAMGGPMGASITQQTDAAKNLGTVAKQYSTGQLTAAQQTQVQQFIQQQRAMVDTQLAASGNPDSSARQAAYQQIDDNAAQLGQSLINQNTQLAEGALTAVQGTYSNLLNQALSSSEFGFSTQEAAVQTQIQSDTALAQSLNQLFAGIAQGVGSAMGGGKTPGGGSGVAGAAGNVVGQVAKGVAGSAAGGSAGTGVAASQSDQASSDIQQSADSSAWYDQQATSTDVSTQLNQQNFDFSQSSDFPAYESYSAGDPFGGG